MTTIDLPVILLSAAVTVATGRKAEVVTDRLTDILNGRWRYESVGYSSAGDHLTRIKITFSLI